MYPEIKTIIAQFTDNAVSPERKKLLQPLADYIRQKAEKEEDILLNFICTHNSRRSHLSQIWAQTMAHYFGVKNVFCYSGGTEATAMFPKVKETLETQGFKIQLLCNADNPVYAVKYTNNQHPVIAFSKKYDEAFNPESGFCAIMTCSSADQGCPFIAGAEKRLPIQYEDPKLSDGTAEMNQIYTERSLQIANEMWWVFKQVK